MRDGGRRTLLPVKRRSLPGLLSEFSLTFCEGRRSAITEESLSLKETISFLCLRNNYENLFFLLFLFRNFSFSQKTNFLIALFIN